MRRRHFSKIVVTEQNKNTGECFSEFLFYIKKKDHFVKTNFIFY